MPPGAQEIQIISGQSVPVRTSSRNRSAASRIPVSTENLLLDTPRGPLSLMALAVGDRVQTRDNGVRPVTWIGTRGMSTRDLTQFSHLRPIHIKKDALGPGMPRADVTVLPNQRVFAARAQSMIEMVRDFDMVPAKYLLGVKGVHETRAPWFIMRYAMFERHQIIAINGLWVESLQPADTSQFEHNNSQVLELKEVFSYCSTIRGTLPSKEVVYPNYSRPWTEAIS